MFLSTKDQHDLDPKKVLVLAYTFSSRTLSPPILEPLAIFRRSLDISREFLR